MRYLLVAIAAMLVCVGTAEANGPWLETNLGYASYSMSDVNDVVGEMNEAVGASLFDEVNGGLNVGINLGYETSGGFGFGVGWEHLFGKTEYEGGGGQFRLNLPANIFKGMVDYRFQSASSVSLFLRGEFGIVSTVGDAFFSADGTSMFAEYEGSSFYTGGNIGVELTLSSSAALTGQVGYRYANLSGVEDNGVPLYALDGSEMEHDYSGVVGRVGFRFYFSGTNRF